MKSVTRRAAGAVSAASIVLASCLWVLVGAAPAQAAGLTDAPQLQQRKPGLGVTADPLPTVQLDGSSSIVWAQDIVGDTVYAGGSFANVRPAGAAPGTNLTPRGNLLAYNITTGQLKQGWAPTVNGTVKAIKASPDGKRIYVGGSFTVANGATRYNLAAFDAVTGDLVAGFNAAVGGSYVNAIAVTDSAVYVGGLIGAGNGVTRKNLAAFSPSGALLGWAPTTDLQVDAMVMDPTGTKVIVGGRFGMVNDVLQRGMGALDPVSGALLPWAAANVVKNGVPQGQPNAGNAGIFSLTADSNAVYGTGWVYADVPTGNLEGTFSAAKGTGDIVWIADCHGDHYGVFSDGSAVYTTSHEHACETTGAMRQGTGSPGNMRNATAVTAAPQGILPRTENVSNIYADWSGYPGPAAINWYPEWLGGTASGQGQAGWTITGNSQFISVGGEFIGLNNLTQQGLVRFAKQPVTGAQQGPRLSGDAWAPTATSVRSGAVSVSIQANYDRDDRDLTYEFRRTDKQQPFATLVRSGTYWHQPLIRATDTSATPGSTYTYQVRAVDGDGNAVLSKTVDATASSAPQTSTYASRVMDDAPQLYWRLGSSGLGDQMGAYAAQASNGVSNTTGALSGDSNQASSLNGNSNGLVRSSAVVPLTADVSIELWFKTSTTSGGKLAGYGSSATGTSGTVDRNVYMSNDGRLNYSVLFGSQRTMTTTDTFNDNKWHHLVVSQGMAGSKLYVDGQVKASDGSIRYARTFNGYWRVGGDSTNNLPNRGTSQWFAGSVDEFAVYPYVLDPTTVSQHRDAGAGVGSPQAKFTSSTSGLTANLDGSSSTVDPSRTIASYSWDFGDGTPAGSGATPSHSYAAEGTYPVTLTITDSSGSTSSATQQVTVTAPLVPPVAKISSSADGLSASFDGSGSTATSPATISSYAWKFGDGGTATGATPKHVYAAAGTYTVTLTVTDSKAQSSSTTASVTVTHADPVASFSSTVDALSVSVDGTGSTTSDGASISSYAWTWGDGTTGSGATASHGYAQAGTYTVGLKVTDSLGSTATTTRDVTVFTVTPKAADSFARTVGSGWGNADIGGAWSGVAGLSVSGGVGRLSSGASDTRTTTLPVSVGDAVHEFSVSSDKVASGGLHVNYLLHRSGSGEYRVKLRYAANGVVNVSLARLVGTTETLIADRVLTGYTHTAGGTLLVKTDSVTAGGTTTLRAKVWPQGTAEPSTWFVTANDSTAALQAAGQVGFSTYTGGSTSNGPITVLVDDYKVTGTQLAPPVAKISSSVSGLTASLDGSGSTATSPATVASYDWKFGDGGTATGATPQHAYASAGTYTVTLTVTDTRGESSSATASVTVSHADPTPSFTSTVDALSVSVNGSGSSAADGASISSYAWNWGDTATDTGATASHTYAQPGTYTVRLTVTDSLGATATTTRQVTVFAVTPKAADAFGRTQASGWGTADIGGDWTGVAGLSVAGGAGRITSAAADTRTTALPVSVGDAVHEFSVSSDKVANGGLHVNYLVHRSGAGEYRLKLRYAASGTVNLSLARLVGTTETLLADQVVPGYTHTPGGTLNVKLDTASAGGSTTLRAKVWVQGAAEPSSWSLTATDSTAALQAAGQVGFSTYTGGSTSNGPITVLVDDLRVN